MDRLLCQRCDQIYLAVIWTTYCSLDGDEMVDADIATRLAHFASGTDCFPFCFNKSLPLYSGGISHHDCLIWMRQVNISFQLSPNDHQPCSPCPVI
jgi:hypothetical protein